MLEDDRKTINERLNKHSDRIDDVEGKVDETAVTITILNRLFWIVLTAVVGTMTYQYIV